MQCAWSICALPCRTQVSAAGDDSTQSRCIRRGNLPHTVRRGEAVALKGTLKDFSLIDIFQILGSGKKTGTLHLVNSDNGAEGMVCFYDGRVFFASSNWHREPLGERLVAAGKITSEQLDSALKQQEKEGGPTKGRKLGEILVEAGHLNQKSLQTFVQNQIHDSLFDLFRWDDGQVEFCVGDVPLEEDIGISVSVENVIMEASRRLESWGTIKKKIPALDAVFSMSFVPATKSVEVHLRPAEWKLLCWVDGETDINGILQQAHMDDFQACQILYGLLCSGLIEKADEPVEERLRKLDLRRFDDTPISESAPPPPPPAFTTAEDSDVLEASAEPTSASFKRDRSVDAATLDRLIAVVEEL